MCRFRPLASCIEFTREVTGSESGEFGFLYICYSTYIKQNEISSAFCVEQNNSVLLNVLFLDNCPMLLYIILNIGTLYGICYA